MPHWFLGFLLNEIAALGKMSVYFFSKVSLLPVLTEPSGY
jgi:hypothetical protein